MMRKWIAALTVFMLLQSLLLCGGQTAVKAAASGKQPFQLIFNGRTVISEPVYAGGTALVKFKDAQQVMPEAALSLSSAKVIGVKNTLSVGAIRVGSRIGYVNGAAKTYGAAPQMRSGSLYVPLRFLVDALGGQLNWNNSERYAEVTYPQYVTGKGDKGVYLLEGLSGTLYYRPEGQAIQKVGPTLAKLVKGYVPSSAIAVTRIGTDSELVTVTHAHGEPMINEEIYTLFIRNGKLLQQMHAHYWQFGASNISTSEGEAVMTDGRHVQFVNALGAVTRTVDLYDWSDIHESFAVEGGTIDYLLARESRDGQLLLIDPARDKAVVLWKEFSAKFAGVKYDGIEFEKQVGTTLYFTGLDGETGKKTEFTWELKVAPGKAASAGES